MQAGAIFYTERQEELNKFFINFLKRTFIINVRFCFLLVHLPRNLVLKYLDFGFAKPTVLEIKRESCVIHEQCPLL